MQKTMVELKMEETRFDILNLDQTSKIFLKQKYKAASFIEHIKWRHITNHCV